MMGERRQTQFTGSRSIRFGEQLLSKGAILRKDNSRLESARGNGIHELGDELLVNRYRGIRLQINHGGIDGTRGWEAIQLFSGG